MDETSMSDVFRDVTIAFFGYPHAPETMEIIRF